MKRTLLILSILFVCACAHAPRQVSRSNDEKKESKIVVIWKKLNPYYKSEWKWWQKLIYWVGPGH